MGYYNRVLNFLNIKPDNGTQASQVKIKKLVTISLGFPALLLSIVVGSYLLWPYWVTNVIEIMLPDTGLRIESGEFSRPGFGSMNINNLGLVYRVEGNEFSVQSQNMELGYNLESLLKGELLAIHGDRVNLQHRQLPLSGRAKKPAGQGFPLVMPGELIKQLPDMSSEGPVKLETRIKVNSDNEIELSLKQAGESIAAITSQFERQDNIYQWVSQASVDLRLATRLAQQFEWVDKSLSASGRLDAQWQAAIPDNITAEKLQALEVTGNIKIDGKLIHEKQNIAAEYQLQTRLDGNPGKVVASLGRLKITGTQQVEEDILAVLPVVAAKCRANPECAQFFIEASPGAELVFRTEPLSVSVTKAAIPVTLGINHAVDKNKRANTSTDGLFSRTLLKNLELHLSGEWQLKGDFDSSLLVHSLAFPEVETGRIAGLAAGQFAIGPNGGRIHIDSNAQMGVQQIKAGDGLVPSFTIGNGEALDIRFSDEKIEVASTGFDLKVPGFTLDKQDFSLQGGKVKLNIGSIDLNNPEQNSVDAELMFSDIEVNRDGMRLAPLSITSEMTLRGNILSGRHRLNDRTGIIQVDGQYQHNTQKNTGSIEFNLRSIAFSEDKTYLPKFIKGWEYPLDLSSGKASARAHFNWQDGRIFSKTTIDLINLGGFYNRNLFSGMNASFSLEGSLDELNFPRQAVTVAGVNAGAAINNIEFVIHGSPDELYIENFQAELLGGKVSQSSMLYRRNEPDNLANLRLENIQLSELLELQQGVTGEGVLNGQLPMRVSAKGIKMNGGKISAENTGIIRYLSKVPVSKAVSNAGVELALDALENFHYNVLDVNADYTETGDLLLKVKLQGRNPDLEIKRPFHFNLQVRQNIPALLKSLQLTQQISDSIDRRVKNFYKGRK